ncbi:hypothetical protein AC1031_022109 [Aphanomyces cochlioides]|nr:hypothetical protein AC1031_022109 [Aphanomyces cochlioides]
MQDMHLAQVFLEEWQRFVVPSPGVRQITSNDPAMNHVGEFAEAAWDSYKCLLDGPSSFEPFMVVASSHDELWDLNILDNFLAAAFALKHILDIPRRPRSKIARWFR